MRATRDNLNNRIFRNPSETDHVRILERGRVIYRPADEVQNVYFSNRGLVSLVPGMQDVCEIEIGANGVDGITSLEVAFDSPQRHFRRYRSDCGFCGAIEIGDATEEDLRDIDRRIAEAA